MPIARATREAEIGRIKVRFKASPGRKFMRPPSQITREKWTGDVAQVESSCFASAKP
jgi:hypothetical protein